MGGPTTQISIQTFTVIGMMNLQCPKTKQSLFFFKIEVWVNLEENFKLQKTDQNSNLKV